MKRFLTIVLVLLTACTRFQQKNDDRLLARVYNEYLYNSDLENLVPPNTSARDSLMIAQNFITNWIQQQLIIHKAKENLPENDIDFSKQLEEYRNSLIIYTYESRLVRQNLDTNVTFSDIEGYYYDNNDDFKLKENIIKLHYVKLHVDTPELNKFKRLIRSDELEDLHQLEDYCKNFAADYWLEDSWMLFNDIIDKVSIDPDRQEDFLQKNRNIQVKEDAYWYLIKIKEYRLKNSISPLSFEEGNIRSIIINNRKLNLVKNMRKDLLKTAIENNYVEVYK